MKPISWKTFGILTTVLVGAASLGAAFSGNDPAQASAALPVPVVADDPVTTEVFGPHMNEFRIAMAEAKRRDAVFTAKTEKFIICKKYGGCQDPPPPEPPPEEVFALLPQTGPVPGWKYLAMLTPPEVVKPKVKKAEPRKVVQRQRHNHKGQPQRARYYEAPVQAPCPNRCRQMVYQSLYVNGVLVE